MPSDTEAASTTALVLTGDFYEPVTSLSVNKIVLGNTGETIIKIGLRKRSSGLHCVKLWQVPAHRRLPRPGMLSCFPLSFNSKHARESVPLP